MDIPLTRNAATHPAQLSNNKITKEFILEKLHGIIKRLEDETGLFQGTDPVQQKKIGAIQKIIDGITKLTSIDKNIQLVNYINYEERKLLFPTQSANNSETQNSECKTLSEIQEQIDQDFPTSNHTFFDLHEDIYISIFEFLGFDTEAFVTLPLIADSLKIHLQPDTYCENTRILANENKAETTPDSPSQIIELFKKQIKYIDLVEMKQNKENELVLNFFILCKGHLTEKGFQLLIEYSKKGYWTFVSKLIEAGTDVNVSSYTWHKTPLMFVAERGYLPLVQKLIEKGANLNERDFYGNTPLIYAAEGGHLAVAQMLIKKGANVNARNRCGDNALMFATKGSHFDLAQILIENDADVNVGNSSGYNPLMVAAERNFLLFVQKLIKKGASVNEKNDSGDTPLIRAVECRNIDIVQILIAHDANVNAENDSGNTPLMVAAMFGRVDMVPTLLKHGADVNAKNKDGQTPLMIATQENFIEIVQILETASLKAL